MSTTLPPWDLLSFTFGTEPEDLPSIRQCSNITFDYYNSIGDNLFANPPPTAPYNVVVYGAGMEPLIVPMNNSATSGQFRWPANLPAGQSYAISMKDSKGYTGGILTPMVKMVAGTCTTANNLLKTSSLDVAVSGNAQCGQAVVAVNNGTAPYTVEVVPANNGQQKTIHFASSPFSLVLDMSEGVEYFLSVTDSAGHASVKGLYTVDSSSDNSCLGTATTVSAGKFSTLYPGGTAIASATAAVSSGSPSPKLASSAIIAMAVAIPVVAIIVILLTLWLCYKRNRRQKDLSVGEKPEIDTFDPSELNVQGGYTPVPTAYHLGSAPNSNSYHEYSSTNGSQHPLAATPYRLDMSDRQTISTTDGTLSPGGMAPSSAVTSEKRRNLLNPDAHGMGPVASEPFDMHSSSEHASSMFQPRMPPLPPAYSPSPGAS